MSNCGCKNLYYEKRVADTERLYKFITTDSYFLNGLTQAQQAKILETAVQYTLSPVSVVC